MSITNEQNNEVKILLAGKAHREWSNYRIDSSLQTPADAWSVSLGLPDGQFPPQVEPGAEVKVMIGNDVVMLGQIDEVSHSVARQATLSISGRDLIAVLLDSSAPIFVAKEITIEEVIANVVRPLGVSKIEIRSDTAPITSEKINIEPGMTAWDALETAAAANGLWPWLEPDGTLVVGGPDYTITPVATLFLNKDGNNNNVESLEYTRSVADRYSEVTVLAQSHGIGAKGANNIKGVANDPDMKVHRPYISISSDVANTDEAKKRAMKIMSDSRLNAVTVTVVVNGHRTSSGELWTPGQRVEIKSDVHGLDEVWFLMARTFTGGREEPTRTELTFKEDGIWSIEAYKAKQPKAKAGKNKGKRKTDSKKGKLTPIIIDV
ncbi:phage baseplate assembly protein [Oligella urethralis]|uniref:phage baseplate assembly protein n=1 Tax=Oligella urethralis TaxID=90245 RepID=UPI00288A4DB9|nr:phage tail protein [Oligella urethralis]